MLVDSHCHIDRLNYKDLHTDVSDVLTKAKQRGVNHCLAVSILPSRFPHMLDLVKDYPEVALSCGMHPLHVAEETLDLKQLREYAEHQKVVAIGETGLDYFYAKETKDLQVEAFTKHIDLAVELNKPLIIHTREARADTLALLREHKAEQCGGVLHCFTEDLAMAEAAMELGFYISASGIISFKSAKALQEVFKAIPLDRILVETDSPYLAPVPYRGEENQPAYTRQVAQCVADLKGITLAEVAEQTTENYFNLFKAPR